MKKLLLFAAAAAVTVSAMADATVYTYVDDSGEPLFGALRRVSPNGRWAVGGDDFLNLGSFIIDTEDPENYVFTSEGFLMDIDDNGVAVGTWYELYPSGAQYSHAALYKDGVWTLLEEPDELLRFDGQALYSTATAISNDGRTIAGCASCRNDNPDEPGKRFPITWVYDDAQGKYVVGKLYNNLNLPGAMGFVVYDMTPDGKYICGLQNLNMGGNIGVILDTATGELMTFHTLEMVTQEWEYKGETYVDEVLAVDGVIDEGQFQAWFTYATNDYIYGARDIVYDAASEDVDNVATIYDIATGEFIDGNADEWYLCGYGTEDLFTTSGTAYINGVSETLSKLTGSTQVSGIYAISDDAKVMTGSRVFSASTGDVLEAPVLVMFDEAPFDGITYVTVAPSAVKVNGRTITATAADVAVYNVSGALVSRQSSTTVTPGIYIVVADGRSTKVIVK